jgi:hypothetical protein
MLTQWWNYIVLLAQQASRSVISFLRNNVAFSEALQEIFTRWESLQRLGGTEEAVSFTQPLHASLRLLDRPPTKIGTQIIPTVAK